jgi:hypothetical protein
MPEWKAKHSYSKSLWMGPKFSWGDYCAGCHAQISIWPSSFISASNSTAMTIFSLQLSYKGYSQIFVCCIKCIRNIDSFRNIITLTVIVIWKKVLWMHEMFIMFARETDIISEILGKNYSNTLCAFLLSVVMNFSIVTGLNLSFASQFQSTLPIHIHCPQIFLVLAFLNVIK